MNEIVDIAQTNEQVRDLVSSLKSSSTPAETYKGYRALDRLLANRPANLRIRFRVACFTDEFFPVADQKAEWRSTFSGYNDKAQRFHGNQDFSIREINDDHKSITCEVVIPPDAVAPNVVGGTHGSGVRQAYDSGDIREFISCLRRGVKINPDGYGGMGHGIRGVELEIPYRNPTETFGVELISLEFVQ